MAVQKILHQLKKFSFFDTFKHASTYFSGTILVHLLGIVTLPVFTAYLTEEEYGVVNVFTSYLTTIVVLLTFNLHWAISRYYFEEDKPNFDEFLGTIFISVSIIFWGQGIMLILFKDIIYTYLNIPSHLVLWLVLTAYLIVVYNFYAQVLIAKKESKRYATIQVAWQYVKFGITMLGLIYLSGVIYLEKGIETSYTFMGKIIGEWIGTLLIALYAFFQIYQHMSFRNVKYEYLKYALVYAIPLIPFALSNQILTSFDQWFINSTVGHAETGQYAFAYKIGLIYLGLVTALLNGASPSYYNYMNKKDYGAVKGQVESMSKLLVLGAGFLMLFAVDAGTLLSSSPVFLDALPIAPVIVGAYVFYGISSFANRGIYFVKKNSYLAVIVLVSGVINILLNYYFIGIKKYTYQAAAYTTLVSYFIMMLISIFVTKYILKLPPLPLGRILKYIVLLGAVIAVNYTLGAPNVGLHIGWIVFKGALLILLGLFLFYDKIILLLKKQPEDTKDDAFEQSKND